MGDGQGAVSILERFVQREYPECDGLLVFGSQLRGSADAQSDIDAIILLTSVECCYHELKEDEGTILDLHVYDPPGLLEAIRKEQRMLLARLAASVAGARVLRDRSGAAAKMQQVARGVLHSPMGIRSWDSHRASIQALLKNVRAATTEPQRLSSLNALYHMVTKILMLKSGQWLTDPIQAVSVLERLDSGLCQRLHEVYREAVVGDSQGFVALLDDVLGMIGGPIAVNERRLIR